MILGWPGTKYFYFSICKYCYNMLQKIHNQQPQIYNFIAIIAQNEANLKYEYILNMFKEKY